MSEHSKLIDSDLLLVTKPSQWQLGISLIAHLLALVACMANALPLMVKTVLLAAVASLGSLVVRRQQAKQVSIAYSDCSGWVINGQAVTILPATTVCQFAIFLQFTAQNNKCFAWQSAVIFCDALQADDFRQLLVKLKTTFLKAPVI